MTPPGHELSAIVQLPVGALDSATAGLEPVAGEAPLRRIINTLLDGVGARIVVVAADPIADAVRGVLTEYNEASVRVVAVEELATPVRFLAAGLEFIEREHPSSRWVLVHDLRQPLVSPPVKDRVLARLRAGDPVVVPALPVTDSVKAVDERGSVVSTLDRTTLRAVQYPRGFVVAHLAELLNRARAERGEDIDAAVLARGPITMVDGDSDAFVAELSRDAAYLEAIIESRRAL